MALKGPPVETLHGLKALKVVIRNFSCREKKLKTGYKHQINIFSIFSKLPIETIEVSLQAYNRSDQHNGTDTARFGFAQRIKSEITGEVK